MDIMGWIFLFGLGIVLTVWGAGSFGKIVKLRGLNKKKQRGAYAYSQAPLAIPSTPGISSPRN